jgi:hypothetical protein
MSDQVWALVFLLIVICAIIVITGQILGMRGAQATDQAEIARDKAYKQLAEDALATQQATLEEQRKTAEALAQVQTRLGAIEKMLSEVG